MRSLCYGRIGADHVLFSSDYPHPEGLREPRDYISRLAGCDDTTTRKVLRENAAALFGLLNKAPAAVSQ